MNDKFFTLKQEKQDKMINGAMQVFALKGYSKASTDDMVKVAGVSKGLWFHYFENKIGLYSFMVEYAVKYMNMELETNEVGGSDNYFEVAMQIEGTKVTLSRLYPYIPLLLASMDVEDDPEALAIIDETIGTYKEKLVKAYENVRNSDFKPQVSREQLDMTMKHTLTGLLREDYASGFDGERYILKVQEYLDMMAKLCY